MTIRSNTARPVGLMFDRPNVETQKRLSFPSRYIPMLPGAQADLSIQEWSWANGPTGTGYSIETPESHAGGGASVGRNAWLRSEGRAMPAGKVTEIDLPAAIDALDTSGRVPRFMTAFEFGVNQDYYLTTRSQYIVGISHGSGATSIAADFGASSPAIQTDGSAFFDGSGINKVYVGLTSTVANKGIASFDGAAWTLSTSGVQNDRVKLATVYWNLGPQLATGGLAGTAGTGGNRLIATNAAGTGFYHVAGDPLVANNWSTLIPIKDSTNFPIQSVVAANRTFWVALPNGIHSIDELGYSPNISKWFEVAYSPANASAVTYWEGIIWTVHEQGLCMIPTSGVRKDIASFIQFGMHGTNRTQVFGRPRALAPSPWGLFVAYYDGHDSYIGLLQVDDGGMPKRWSMAEAVIEGQEVTFLQYTSPQGDPRLMIGTIATTGNKLHLYSQDQPQSGDPEIDYRTNGLMQFATDWSVDLSRFNGGTPVRKTFRRFTGEFDGLGSAHPLNTVDILVAPDGGTAVRQGTATTSPQWTGTPKAAQVRATSAQVTLSAHNTESDPVIIRSFAAHYSPSPELTRVTTYPVIFGEGVVRLDKRPDDRDPGIVLAQVEHAQRDGPVQVIQQTGRTISGVIEPGLNEVWTEENGNWTVRAQVTISESQHAAIADVDAADSGAVAG